MEKKTQCSCVQSSYDYGGKQNVLIGHAKHFEIDKILVISLKEKQTFSLSQIEGNEKSM